jgi:ketosteroid isomerase-like protein
MDTQTLLDTYYGGLARKEGWDSVLAEDFRFVGGDMTKPTPQIGKANYIQIVQRLSRLFTGVRVLKSFVDGDEAFVLATYAWTFPHGVNVEGAVAELWKIQNGKLQELTIFFDTQSFDRLTKG